MRDNVSVGTVLIRAEIVENKHGQMIRAGGVYFAFDEVEIVDRCLIEAPSEECRDTSDVFGPPVGPPTEKRVKGVDIDDSGF